MVVSQLNDTTPPNGEEVKVRIWNHLVCGLEYTVSVPTWGEELATGAVIKYDQTTSQDW